MSSDIAVSVQNLSKCYHIYSTPFERLKQFASAWFHGLIGLQANKYYSEFWALNEVSLDIKKGETVSIIGRNGSGKSTLLQMICGTLNPTSGELYTQGRVAALLELGSGFNPEFTGKENVYMNAAVLGLDKNEINECYDDIVAFAEIGNFIDQPVKTYSSGMYVRLAFSVAINVSPDILIIDEALAVGDAAFQAKCMKKFEEFRINGVTIILVTHDLGSVLQFSSRCVLLDEGKKNSIENPKLAVDAFKKILLGSNKNIEEKGLLVDARVADLQKSDWAKNYQMNYEGSEIYGNGKAQIFDLGIFDESGKINSQKLFLGDIYSFKMKIQFHDFVDEPIFTLTFRDLTGREVAGTNTRNKQIATGKYTVGDIVDIKFDIKTRLAPGNYLLTFACSGFEGEDFVVYERLYHILIIEIIGTEQIVGYFDLQAEIEHKKRKGLS